MQPFHINGRGIFIDPHQKFRDRLIPDRLKDLFFLRIPVIVPDLDKSLRFFMKPVDHEFLT